MESILLCCDNGCIVYGTHTQETRANVNRYYTKKMLSK